MNQKIGLALAFLAGAYLYLKGNAASQLQIAAARVQNLSISGLNLVFDIVLDVQNFTPQNITINGFGGFLTLNRLPFGRLSTNNQITFRRYDSTEFIVPVQIQLTSTLSQLTAVQQFLKGQPLILEMQATARTLGITIPLDSKVVLNNPFKAIA